jgi:hypothetical protein
MTMRRLERTEWIGFCAYASRGLIGRHANIEVASRAGGTRLEARQLPLFGMAYDPKDDVLELFVGQLRHLIWAPREFYVDEVPLGLVCLEIIDADGVREIVTLREPLMLPRRSAVSDSLAAGARHAI